MNKTQLVDALAARIGDRRTAATLVDGLLETIVDTVRAGGAVSISGFGVFESRARAARVARNPRTGEAVPVPATTVPAFRAGMAFRTAVGGGGQAGDAHRGDPPHPKRAGGRDPGDRDRSGRGGGRTGQDRSWREGRLARQGGCGAPGNGPCDREEGHRAGGSEGRCGGCGHTRTASGQGGVGEGGVRRRRCRQKAAAKAAAAEGGARHGGGNRGPAAKGAGQAAAPAKASKKGKAGAKGKKDGKGKAKKAKK